MERVPFQVVEQHPFGARVVNRHLKSFFTGRQDIGEVCFQPPRGARHSVFIRVSGFSFQNDYPSHSPSAVLAGRNGGKISVFGRWLIEKTDVRGRDPPQLDGRVRQLVGCRSSIR
jgi:hypothetical protein